MPLDIPEPAARECLRRAIAQALNIAAPVEDGAIEASLAWADAADHYLIAMDDPRYPPALREISAPPPLLFVQGRVELLQAEAIAIVGSRNATPQGMRDSQSFAMELSSRELCVVSGLALGIDAAAHRGGLAQKGSSIAVLGTGPDREYPVRNRELRTALNDSGCVITEFPPGTEPHRQNFPQRNRIISGLSRGVLVVEAATESGSLVTARCAAEQGRTVFVLPGSIHAPLSRGCHLLAREGAILVTEVDHILEDIPGWASRRRATVAPPLEARDPFLDAMGFVPLSLDAVASLTGLDARAIALRLARFELDGVVQRLAGGLYQRRR